MFGIKRKEKQCGECPKIAEAKKIAKLTETFEANESINFKFNPDTKNFGGIAF